MPNTKDKLLRKIAKTKFVFWERVLLVAVTLLGAFLYLHNLGSNPPGLYLDEVGTGYNTYSILKTGKDEYGKAFPLAFRLFGSYTPPLYIYLSVPLVAIFDLSIFSTRLLSAISGIIAIPIFFFIVKELKIAKLKFVPIISTLFFAITPWLVYFSRVGYEQNLAFLFFLVSVLLVAKTIKNPKLAVVTIPFISLATYSDYPQRFTAPLLFIGVAILFFKNFKVKKNLKQIIVGSAIAFIIQIPNLYFVTTPSFYTKTEHFYLDVITSQSPKIEHFLPVFLSEPLAFIREFTAQFVTYLSPRSLFFLPDDDPQRSLPALSVFYSWMVIPYLIGLYIIIKNRKENSSKLILLLLLIAPIAGALTKQPFHIQRTLALLLPISLAIAIGIDKILSSAKVKLWLPATAAILIFSLVMLWRSYFVLLPKLRATTWAFEFAPLTEFIKSHPNDTFVIDQSTRTRPQDMAYIQIAFYLKVPPELLQADQDPEIAKNYYYKTDFSFIHKFANIETRAVDWSEVDKRDLILVGDTVAISDLEVKNHNLNQVFEVDDPAGNIVLRGFKTSLKNK